MPEYRVMWEIDLSAPTPEEAAREALKIQRDPESLALFFTVFEEGILEHKVDLLLLNAEGEVSTAKEPGLTEEQAEEIRRLLPSTPRAKELANKIGISASVVYEIWRSSPHEEEKEGQQPRIPSSAVELKGSFPNLNTGECPKCGASHAAESICHACGYEYRDILSHDREEGESTRCKNLVWHGKVEKVPCVEHRFSWSGVMPCTGVYHCVLCGYVMEEKEE